jgi:hypothetical protein
VGRESLGHCTYGGTTCLAPCNASAHFRSMVACQGVGAALVDRAGMHSGGGERLTGRNLRLHTASWCWCWCFRPSDNPYRQKKAQARQAILWSAALRAAGTATAGYQDAVAAVRPKSPSEFSILVVSRWEQPAPAAGGESFFFKELNTYRYNVPFGRKYSRANA